MSNRTHRSNIRILRQPEVTQMTGLSRTTIWRRVQDGSFPHPCGWDLRVAGPWAGYTTKCKTGSTVSNPQHETHPSTNPNATAPQRAHPAPCGSPNPGAFVSPPSKKELSRTWQRSGCTTVPADRITGTRQHPEPWPEPALLPLVTPRPLMPMSRQSPIGQSTR